MNSILEEMDKITLPINTDHSHEFQINNEGFGCSKFHESTNHTHDVVCFECMPSTFDGHVHNIPLPNNEDWEV